MRLIDADALIERTHEAERNIGSVGPTGKFVMEKIREAVEGEPTAYDVEKVVAELEEELKRADIEKQRCASENPMQFDVVKGYSTGISNALEIVRNGGKE